MEFKKRLKDLRNENELSQEELAKKVHMKRVSIMRYESGEREPGTSTLRNLADFFNVSIDYLVGETDIRESLSLRGIEDIYFQLTAENKLQAISYIKFLKENQDGTPKKA